MSGATLTAAPVASGRPAPAPVSRWWLPGAADLVFLFVAMIALRGARHAMLDDPGLGWHLRNVDAILAEGGWLTADPFTEPGDGPPRAWYTNQWLGELPLWLGWRLAGREGIAVVAALVIALLARCVYRTLLADGLPWPAAVLWTALIAVGTSCSWSARPNLFTILFIFITARACVLYHEGRLTRGATLWLWPLFAVWANVHGGFVAGFTLLGGSLLVEAAVALLAFAPDARQGARRRLGHFVLLLAGAAAATLVNPYGWRLYPWVLQLLRDPYFMSLHQEWLSPDFRAGGAMRYELLLLLFPLLLAVSRKPPNLVGLALALLWLHFALTGFRYVALWVVIAGPLMARSSLTVPWLEELACRLGLSAEEGGPLGRRTGPAPWVWSAAFALALLGWGKSVEGSFARHKPEIIAAPALDRFLEMHAEWRREHGRRPVVFHSYDWGGYLTWRGWPEVKNWIDDRNEVQGRQRVEEYFSLLRADPGWREKLDRAGVDLICVESAAPLARRLAEDGGWTERYRDEFAVIFERATVCDRN